MSFKVYELGTDKDVTDEKEWYINTDGTLLFISHDFEDDFNASLHIASEKYYYKLEIEVQ